MSDTGTRRTPLIAQKHMSRPEIEDALTDYVCSVCQSVKVVSRADCKVCAMNAELRVRREELQRLLRELP